jgi:DNA polymerase-1
MISALLSKDPAKLAVYLNGIDAHCQNTYAYFKEEMPDIDPATPASINTIASKYPDHRQRSKTVTFALTYGAGVQGLVQNTQLNEKTARKLVRRYHELYKVSDLYTWQRLEECSEKGYTLLAFGLPLQTPVLKQTLLNSRRLTKEAHKEMKSVANAFIQSYGLLNTVSANRFMERVWNSPYRLDIFPVAQIHDSQYYLCRNSLRILHWLNINLIECMVKFDDLPEIFHTRVKLAADLEVYFPDWAHPRRIPNNASPEILLKHLREPP